MSITYLPGKEPHPRETRRILKNVNREGWNTSIDCYLADGGYEELKKALGMEPRAVIDEVKKIRSSRPWRRGVPHRREMDLHSAEQHEACLSGLQL